MNIVLSSVLSKLPKLPIIAGLLAAGIMGVVIMHSGSSVVSHAPSAPAVVHVAPHPGTPTQSLAPAAGDVSKEKPRVHHVPMPKPAPVKGTLDFPHWHL